MFKFLTTLLLGVFLSNVEAHENKTPISKKLADKCDECLSIKNASTQTFKGYDGQPKTVTGPESKGSFGSLVTNSAGTVYATYLGNESSYSDSFRFSNGALLNESNKLGDTISSVVAAGTIGFSFFDNMGGSFANGATQSKVIGFMILDGAIKNEYAKKFGTFDYLLGFNDSFKGDADYDDYVVGINFASVSPVPEPESYLMLLVGLGLITVVARRQI